MDTNKRKYPRVVYSAVVNVISVVNSGMSCRGVIKNISLGGLAIETEDNLSVGGEYLFNFYLPDTKNIKITGKIVWEYKDKVSNYYGIQFVSVGFFSKFRLKRFIDNSLKYEN